MIVTTVGVYPNGSFKTNGVKQEHLKEHIEYNKLWRFGRALIVDGKIEYCGYWKQEELQAFIEKEKINEIRIDKCTAPYQ